ncbi:MAG: DUF1365 domain-containing protein [Sphingomonadales bacterium]
MSIPEPGLFVGDVIHTRIKPVRHRLRYRVFYLLLDVDDPAGGLRVLSHNRFNLFTFRDRDHGGGEDAPLRHWVDAEMTRAGLARPHAIRLLTLPRVLGHVFNPISLYYCYGADGALIAAIYEVNNTFGERHSYLVPGRGEDELEHDCPKQFYVSPFNTVTGTYRMTLTRPEDKLAFAIHHRDEAGPLMFAGLSLDRRRLDDRALVCQFFAMPLMTLKIITAIHWEAFRLWRKGLAIKTRPAPPDPAVTIIKR